MKQKHKEVGKVIIKKEEKKERREWLNLEKKVEIQVLFSASASYNKEITSRNILHWNVH